MGKIRSVLGDINTDDMGFTMPHEHLLTKPRGHGSIANDDHCLDSLDKAVEMLIEFKNAGGGCIVETTPESWGRNPEGMREASERGGVHVLACTGYICEEHGSMTEEVSGLTVNQVADRFIRDIEEGMNGTGIRAGWVKAGSAYNYISANEEKVLRAAAIASMKTGVCLHTHTTNGTMGLEQIEIVEREGFDPGRMIIAHVDRNPDLWYHRKMLSKGVYLIYDGPGKAKYYPDSMRVELLKQLVSDGYTDRLMLSNDMGRKSHHKVYGYGPGFTWIKEKFLPRLIEEGLSIQDTENFMIHNPARIYTMRQ